MPKDEEVIPATPAAVFDYRGPRSFRLPLHCHVLSGKQDRARNVNTGSVP